MTLICRVMLVKVLTYGNYRPSNYTTGRRKLQGDRPSWMQVSAYKRKSQTDRYKWTRLVKINRLLALTTTAIDFFARRHLFVRVNSAF